MLLRRLLGIFTSANDGVSDFAKVCFSPIIIYSFVSHSLPFILPGFVDSSFYQEDFARVGGPWCFV